MPLEACMPEIVSRFNSQYRRPRKDGDTTLAAHWDGTYRDRVAHCRGYAVAYWADPLPNRTTAVSVKKIAKHREET